MYLLEQCCLLSSSLLLCVFFSFFFLTFLICRMFGLVFICKCINDHFFLAYETGIRIIWGTQHWQAKLLSIFFFLSLCNLDSYVFFSLLFFPASTSNSNWALHITDLPPVVTSVIAMEFVMVIFRAIFLAFLFLLL